MTDELRRKCEDLKIEVRPYEWRGVEHYRWKHRRNEKESNIYCPFCGFCCRSLAGHLVVHGIKKEQSKAIFGLRKKGRMTCLSTHIRYSNENARRFELGILKPRKKTKSDTLAGNIPEESMTYVKKLNEKYIKQIESLRSKLAIARETIEELCGCWHYLKEPAKTDFKELFGQTLQQIEEE